MKAGDIVRISGDDCRDWVALRITQRDIRRGVNARAPGMYLFGGAWYGRDLMSKGTYGKIIPAKGPRKVVGHVKARRTLPEDLSLARRNMVSSLIISRVRDHAEYVAMMKK